MKIALLVPCYNEEKTISQVIEDFQRYLPQADIYVYDNNSADATAEIAARKGAIVKHEYKQGKANAVRSMFRQIDADIYIMVDGDNTYPASQVNRLLEIMEQRNCDMVVGDRLSNGTYTKENTRAFHNLGNNMVRWLINFIFKSNLNDIMTGYRVFSKRFVKNYPVMCSGFELETEMTIYALNNHLNIEEVTIDFIDRPEGSFSKLNTFTDGRKVIFTIFNLFRHYKPLQFFGSISIFVVLVALFFGIPPIIEFIKYHYVYKIPSAILASGLMIIALLSLAIGLILDTIAINDKKYIQIILQRNQK
jgi:glycosyltransferase involved in cell wall biosynthesis